MPTFSIFGDIRRFARSRRMDEENITVIFGDIKLDFTRTTLDLGDHHLRIFSIFGDTRLRIPHEVGVEIDSFTLFGDVEVEDLLTGEEEQPGASYITEQYATAPVRARISVFSLFGDVEVVRVPVSADGNRTPATGATARLLGNSGERTQPERYDAEAVRRDRSSDKEFHDER
ncbi:MAG: cell wall-active antibiotics response protein [Roseiflexaceae bacterium]|nr:cell wall-active antibiotics response protein [Roseiflexaceae bacterium]